MIKSNHLEKYNLASRYAHELLANILEEYKKHCERVGKLINADIRIKKVEFHSSILDSLSFASINENHALLSSVTKWP